LKFKIADCRVGGWEYEAAGDPWLEGKGGIFDSTIVGSSLNEETDLIESQPRGIIAPRSEWFKISDIRFHNFVHKDHAALGTCSHCYNGDSTDSGARTHLTEKLKFYNCNMRIRYQVPYNAIFNDLDGTLTELGPNTWTTGYGRVETINGRLKEYYLTHIKHVKECKLDVPMYDGFVCDNTVQVRRVAFADL